MGIKAAYDRLGGVHFDDWNYPCCAMKSLMPFTGGLDICDEWEGKYGVTDDDEQTVRDMLEKMVNTVNRQT